MTRIFWFIVLVLGQSGCFASDTIGNAPFDSEPSIVAVEPRPSPAPGIHVCLGSDVVIYSGKYAGAGPSGMIMNGGVVVKPFTGIPVFVGADMGLDSWDFSTQNNVNNYRVTGIQGLPTAYYRFDSITDAIYPYFGVSAGPYAYLPKLNSAKANSDPSQAELEIYFELLFRPGVAFKLSPGVSLNVEPKFGILHSSPVFLPLASANLSL